MTQLNEFQQATRRAQAASRQTFLVVLIWNSSGMDAAKLVVAETGHIHTPKGKFTTTVH